MSYLFKKNKKIIRFIKFILIIFIFIIFYKGINLYTANKFFYSVFSLLSSYLIFFGFRKKAIFFETFLSVLIWLGFWFKFTFLLIFRDGQFDKKSEFGLFDASINQLDEVLLISITGISAIIISGHVREIFFNYPKKITFTFDYYRLYEKYRVFILLFFSLIVMMVAFFNWNYSIYQKGIVSLNEHNPLISGILKWLLLFGLSSFGAIILFLEGVAFKKIFFLTFFVIAFEFFLSSTSMMSRGMVFNAFAVLYGLYKYANKFEIKFNIKYFLSFLLTILILFYISINIVHIMRYDKFFYKEGVIKLYNEGIGHESVGKLYKKGIGYEVVNKESIDRNYSLHPSMVIITGPKKTTILKKSSNEIIYLLVYRWVGIDAVMALVGKKEILNYGLLKESFNERLSKENSTFYESNFAIKVGDHVNKKYHIKDNLLVKGNTLMGIIAFLFYSGSYIFLFFSIIGLCLFGSVLEIITYKFSSNNIILAALIGQVVANRYIHFGFLPNQSYLLIGTILLNIIIIYIVNKLLFKTCNYLK